LSHLFVAGFLLVIFLCGSAFSKLWRGITPLRATRAEVEGLLGRPILSSNDSATYHTDAEAVSIRYSNGMPCGKNANSEWNVPAGHVIAITVAPKTIIQFSPLNLDESKYRKSPDPHRLNAFEYTNTEEGESITVVNGEVTRLIIPPMLGATISSAKAKLIRLPHHPTNSMSMETFGEKMKKVDSTTSQSRRCKRPDPRVTYIVIQTEQLPDQRARAHAEPGII
jgi:hypothetical protein